MWSKPPGGPNCVSAKHGASLGALTNRPRCASRVLRPWRIAHSHPYARTVLAFLPPPLTCSVSMLQCPKLPCLLSRTGACVRCFDTSVAAHAFARAIAASAYEQPLAPGIGWVAAAIRPNTTAQCSRPLVAVRPAWQAPFEKPALWPAVVNRAPRPHCTRHARLVCALPFTAGSHHNSTPHWRVGSDGLVNAIPSRLLCLLHTHLACS